VVGRLRHRPQAPRILRVLLVVKGEIAFMYSFRIALGAFLLASLVPLQGTSAAAASGYTLFGDATLVHPGHNSNTAVQLRSVGSVPATATFGGIDFATPAGMTVG